MTTNQNDALAARVLKLEKDLATLIDHLADNYDSLFDVLHSLVEGDDLVVARGALSKCENGICDIKPPGCKRHDHGHDDKHGPK